MAAAASASILRVPCRLIASPTDLGAAEPYGGTYLGTTRDNQLYPGHLWRKIWGEAAGTYKDAIYAGQEVYLRCVMRYPDADMIANVAPKAIASGSSGIRWLFRPEGTTSNRRAGTSMGTLSFKLLLAPRAATAHPMVILYNAVPLIEESAVIPFGWNEEWALAVTFMGTPDSSGRVFDTGQRANLVL